MSLSECAVAYRPFNIEATTLLLLPSIEVESAGGAYSAAMSNVVVQLSRYAVNNRNLWPENASSWNSLVSSWENSGFIPIFSCPELSADVSFARIKASPIQQIQVVLRNRGARAGICTDSLAMILAMADDWMNTPDASSYDRVDAMTRSVLKREREAEAEAEEEPAVGGGGGGGGVGGVGGVAAHRSELAVPSSIREEPAAGSEGSAGGAGHSSSAGMESASGEVDDPMTVSRVSVELQSASEGGATGSRMSEQGAGSTGEEDAVRVEVMPLPKAMDVSVDEPSGEMQQVRVVEAQSSLRSSAGVASSGDSDKFVMRAVEPMSEQEQYKEEELDLIMQQFAELIVGEEESAAEKESTRRADPVVSWNPEGGGFQIVENFLLETKECPLGDRFFALPEEFGSSTFRLLLRDFSVVASLHAGEDWGSGRNMASSLRLTLKKMNASFDQLAGAGEEGNHSWRLLVGIKDVEIEDMLLSSTWNKFLCYDQQRLRPSDSNMVQVEMFASSPVGALPPEQHTMKVSILPLRLFVDQDALELLEMFGEVQVPLNPDKPPMYFQNVDIAGLHLNIDYKPRRVDYWSILKGNMSAAKDLFPLEQAQFNMQGVHMTSIDGWGEIHAAVKQMWFPYVQPKHVREYVSGVQAVRPLAEVAQGMADLILLPMEQYQRDGRVLRGVQSGASSFLSKLTTQTLDVASKVASGTQVILESTDALLRPRQVAGPLGVTGDEEPRAGQALSKHAQQPTSMWEGTKHAYDRMATELGAASRIVAVPVQMYERGVGGAMVSVIRAVPVAVIRPAAGLFGGLADILKATRNQMDPMHERMARMKYVSSLKEAPAE
eukprot:TRINITY_DN2114_c0_g4_i3.p1 TRINITY_DN2114_c0_g4~~TRINITY_DN2114_c0_g4_i3.p1  ORF type:complete len:845 (+),score=247.32 TRINITY_DN2114_c0_g4_i3:35-2536(+)